MSVILLSSNELEELSRKADDFILAKDHGKLEKFIESSLKNNHSFENLYDEASFYYTMGNCSQEIYNYNSLDWYSDELSKAVILFRKALYTIERIEIPTDKDTLLHSCINTNLGNKLSDQGRFFCCIPLWDEAIKHQNPVALISKARNEISIAGSIYDSSHMHYHYFTAYKLINLSIEHQDKLHPEQKDYLSRGSDLIKFKEWFEGHYNLEEFEFYKEFKDEVETKNQGKYFKWCGDNKLFINDLNDVCNYDIAHQDILTIPSFSQNINFDISKHEELAYHGNFDEIKNDYCYGRFLTFSARGESKDHDHFFNKTYPHVDDMAYSITNLKASHYKSAFRTLYSLFDKIAYFINRFFDLNDISLDYRISFDSIFRNLNNRKKWKPHSKLKNSKNYFIHALFYILKDIRDVQDSTLKSNSLDPDAQEIFKIRNAIEHRSLKIIDDLGFQSIIPDINYSHSKLEQLYYEIEVFKVKIQQINCEFDSEKNKSSRSKLVKEKERFEKGLSEIEEKMYEQKKLSSHSMLITESEFESRLMTLMKLARNSIMYLSLAIHFEEKNKPDDGVIRMSKEVPLKSS